MTVQAEFLTTLGRLTRGIRKRFDARAKSEELTYSRAQALLNVAQQEGRTQTQIAEELAIETPTLNRTLDALEKADLIERRTAAQDRRLRHVFLTAYARRRADKILSFTEDLRDELFRDIPQAELEQALAVLARVLDNLDQMEEEPDPLRRRARDEG
ncbi:hypothetical protein CBW24_15650 (plasmid) [Pacificitalea manganoxidans]|uniref:HTH marR-type domain-containing protein n=1 Tax=Pacificitalea manganoxidans TaxID=1411902 RepID=A0A291M3M2_9RHOB|nr:MarR family transcriptional regulator [Pacificitalea manganoxidans]ATI43583.1 hypothetical protein CBW24_15650 [Pacificitalea manganoxidans]MBF53766.1 hypothetical protein [Actibacterium sp.]MDR6309980.1 MarR family transcriptional regulator for hemolysin [Pacificitalea manganoxidans]|tara:strand:- start:30 stop:500 length:471 start_codon:yes stop_codon:yes gene_type:complete